jgi:hypothetical protein
LKGNGNLAVPLAKCTLSRANARADPVTCRRYDRDSGVIDRDMISRSAGIVQRRKMDDG